MTRMCQLSVFFFAVVFLMCSGPASGRTSMRDGDGFVGDLLRFQDNLDPYRKAWQRIKRETLLEKTNPQLADKKEDPICIPISRSLRLPEDDATYPFGQATIHGWAVFYKSQYSVAFVKPKCVVPGHVLVMPLSSTKRMVDLQSDELVDLFLTTQRVQRGMELFHGVSSSMIAVQDGPDAGQSIEHVHVHIMPRRHKDFEDNDEVYVELNNYEKVPDRNWRTKDEMKKEAKELRQFFKTL